MRMENKVVFITGATGGIGAAMAKQFLNQGASVFLTGRSPEKLADLADGLGAPANVQTCVVDALDEAAVERSVAQCVETFGRIDSIIANAGTEGKVRLPGFWAKDGGVNPAVSVRTCLLRSLNSARAFRPRCTAWMRTAATRSVCASAKRSCPPMNSNSCPNVSSVTHL